ncbi:MAG: o-succinylbenzoate synthase [Myxococcaceae bacterium]|nr:o-succinylbenzoate synthase [Myxococcaceae bacterium]
MSIKLKRPLSTSRGPLAERAGFEVHLAHEGVEGRGEAYPLQAFGTESLADAESVLRTVEVTPVASVDEVAGQLSSLTATPAARFAVESALFEWLARRRGVPVAVLLGEARARVPVNALIDGADAEALVENARKAVDAGFATLKLKVAARSVSLDAQRLHSVRVAVGPRVALRIDANGGWTEGVARSALRGLESLGIEVCEQPVAPHDVEGLRRVTELVPVPVAADEALGDPLHRARVLTVDPRPAAKVLVLKPAVLGGLMPSLELARKASSLGLGCYVTTTMDGPIARAAAAHLAAVLPPSSFAHGLSTPELFEGLAPDAFTAVHGAVTVPSVPGWGV